MSKLMLACSLTALALLASACSSGATNISQGKIIKSAPADNNLTATISNETGELKHGDTEFMLTFTDASGKAVDVGAVGSTFHMPAMGAMGAMNNQTSFTTTGTPGVYKGKAHIEMAGDWQIQITYEGLAGRGQVSIPVTAR
ncbi:MAG: FixH family protein [Pyrinomonadaceae bacterium]